MQNKEDPGARAGATGADQDIAEQRHTQSIKLSTEALPATGTTGDESGDRLPRNDPEPVPDGGASGAEIHRLAALSLDEYERERKPAAKRLRYRVSSLDRLVEAARNAGNAAGGTGKEPAIGDTGEHGRPLTILDIKPWPETVDGALLLHQLATTAREYVIISAVQADALALWILFSHAFDATDVAPKLVVKSSVMRSGKSRLGEVLERTVAGPILVAGGIRPAALLRIIEIRAPTLLLDEMDALLKGNRELRETLRGIMNSGFSRAGARHIMNVPTPGGGWEPREFSTWCPQAFLGIGDLPSTVRDRSIEIRMKRKLATEKVKRLRRNDGEDLRLLAQKSARWAQDNLERLRLAQPETPAGLNDRATDAWEPLFAIADLAGEGWPQRARIAALALSEDTSTADDTTLLLADLRELFADEPSGVLFTGQILKALTDRDDRPWAEHKLGRPITSRQIAGLLRPLGISVGTVRRGAVTNKGYRREDMEDAFSRYLPAAPVTASQPADSLEAAASQSVTVSCEVTDAKSTRPPESDPCDGVTDTEPPS
jgi:hypothetical protein